MKFPVLNNVKDNGFLILQAVFLAAWFAFIVVLDLVGAISVFWQFNAFAVFIALVLLLPSLSSAQRKQGLWLLSLFLVALFFLSSFIALTPVKPFMKFYRQITTGMTESQVRDLLIQHFPKNGRFHRPQLGVGDSCIGYTLDPNDGRYNAEFIFVAIKNDRVVATQYSGD